MMNDAVQRLDLGDDQTPKKRFGRSLTVRDVFRGPPIVPCFQSNPVRPRVIDLEVGASAIQKAL